MARGQSRRKSHGTRGDRTKVFVRKPRKLLTEILEERQLLTAVSWDGGGGDLLWSNPLNWSNNQLPGPDDDVTINAAGDVTIAYDGVGSLSLKSLVLADSLRIGSGVIAVLGNFTINMGQSLNVSSGSASFEVHGSATIDGASLVVTGGTLSLPGATSYTNSGGSSRTATLQASGGGVLDLGNVTNIDLGPDHGTTLQIDAQSGGQVKLQNVTQISDAATNSARRALVTADGAGSVINFGGLVNFLDNSFWNADWHSTLTAKNSGAIQAPLLISLKEVDVALDGTGVLTFETWVNWTNGVGTFSGSTYTFTNLVNANGTLLAATSGRIEFPKLTTLTNGSLSISGGATASVPELSAINGASLLVSGGVALSLPKVTSYTNTSGNQVATLRASGGGVLDLGNVTNVDLGSGHDRVLQIQAQSGGRVDLHKVTQISDAATNSARRAEVLADGAGSQVDLGSLVNFLNNSTWGGWYSSLTARNSGVLQAPVLVGLNGVNVTLDGTGALATGSWTNWTNGVGNFSGATYTFTNLVNANGTLLAATSGRIEFPKLTTLTNGSLSISGGATASVPELSAINGASLLVSGGVALSLPKVTSYTNTSGNQVATLRASGGGVLDLGNVTNVDLGSGHDRVLQIQAQSGGRVDLHKVTQISDAATNSARRAEVLADGAGSQVDLGSLVNFLNNSTWGGWYSSLTAQNNASILFGTLTTLLNTSVSIDSSVFVSGSLLVGVGASLTGQGEIFGNVRNSGGTVTPAKGAQGLTIHGDYTQTAAGRLIVAIDDAVDTNNYARLLVDGKTTLAGTLEITRANSYAPDLFTDYAILSAETVSGTFSTVTGGAIAGGDLTLQYGSSVVALSRSFAREPVATFNYQNTQANQRTFFNVSQVAGGRAQFRVYGPDGKLVTLSNAWPANPNAGDVGTFLLKDIGSYEVRVYGAVGENPSFDAALNPAPLITQPGFFRRATSGEIARPGETQVWEFDARVGDEISLDVLNIIGAGQQLSFTLKDPAGKVVYHRRTAAEAFNAADFGPFFATSDGKYTLTVDGVGDDTAAYQFVVSGPQAPRIRSHAVKGPNPATVNEAWFLFDQAMDTSSFSLAQDLLTFQNPAGAVAPTGFRWEDASTLVITFAPQPADVPLFMVLSAGITNTAGIPLDQDNDRIPGEDPDDQYRAPLAVDNRGPFVIYTQPGTTASAPLDRIPFHFSEPIDAGTFSLADVTQFIGPGGVDLRNQLTNFLVGEKSVTVFFHAQVAGGQFTISIGPNIADAAGNLMDQSRDGVNGQTNDAFTFTTNVQSPDLLVASVANPTPATHGQDITLTWTVQNNGADPATGTWWDYVYLSADDKWDLGDALVGKVLYTGAALAANGGNYVGTLTAPLPGMLPGNYRVIVRTNILESLTEATQSNNTGVSANAARFELPALASGVVATTSVDYREDLYYKFEVPANMAGGSLVLRLGTNNTSVANELYVSRNTLPTRTKHDARSRQGLASNQYIILSALQAGTYYILGAIAPNQQQIGTLGTANLQADLLVPGEFSILDSYFGQGGTAGNRTIEINGVNFDRTVTARLTNAADASIPAVSYYRVGPEKLYATFDLTSVAPGTYNVTFENSAGQVETIGNSLEVVDNRGAAVGFAPSVTAPPAFRRVFHEPLTILPFVVSWSNNGLNDLPTPIVKLSSSEPFSASPDGSNSQLGEEFYALQIGDAPPGLLLPGQNYSITRYSVPLLAREVQGFTNIDLTVSLPYAQLDEPFEWTQLQSYLGEQISDSEYAELLSALRMGIGTTNGDFLWMLSRNANLISEAVAQPITTGDLLSLELKRLHASIGPSISGIVTGANFNTSYAGSSIFAFNLVSGDTYESTVLQDGSFVFDRVTPGRYGIAIQGHLISSSMPEEIVVENAPLQGIRLEVEVGSSIKVNIVDAVGSGSVANATVIAIDSNDGRPVAVADSSSNYTLHGLPDGNYSILVMSSNRSTSWVDGISINGPNHYEEVSILMGQPASLVGSVELPGGVIADERINVVVLMEGLPIVGGFRPDIINGVFSLSNLPAGSYRIQISGEGFELLETSLFTIAPGELHAVGTLILEASDLPPIAALKGIDNPQPPLPVHCEIPLWTPLFSEDVGKTCPQCEGARLKVIAAIKVRNDIASKMNAVVAKLQAECRRCSEEYLTKGASQNKSIQDYMDQCMSRIVVQNLRNEWDALKQDLVITIALGYKLALQLQECAKNCDNKCLGDACTEIEDVGSYDPNDIIGPGGVGEGRWIAAQSTLSYMIRFENDAEKATAPAAVVRITQTLDSDLDFSSFRLGTFGFGDIVITDAVGLASFETRLDYRDSLGIYLDVRAGIDVETGEAFWELKSIDPATGEVPFSPLVGFLPPNANGVEGQGYVTYSVRAKSTVQSGDVIDAVASIVFDQNEAIETPPIFNTIDAGEPTSQVQALASQNFPGFLVTWSGADDDGGSGIRYYDIYVSENGGAFQLWLDDTSATEARYFDTTPGNTYAFYSVAIDLVGHREAAPTEGDAVTLAIEPITTTVVAVNVTQTPHVKITVEFDDAMAVQSLIDSGAIRSVLTVVNYSTGPVNLTNWSFSYDAATRVLTLATIDQLPSGVYELQLDGNELRTEDGILLKGGASGLVFNIPAFEAPVPVQAAGGDLLVGGDATPVVLDWNADGLADLIVGERISGNQVKLRVYLNRGTNAAPLYDGFFYARTTTGEIVVPAAADFSVSARMVDWNGDDELDLVLGLADGRVQLWTNVNTSQLPIFDVPRYLQVAGEASAPSTQPSTSTDVPDCGCGTKKTPQTATPQSAAEPVAAAAPADLDVGFRASIAVVDWDNDGQFDLVVGNADGRVQVYLFSHAEGIDLELSHVVQLGAGTLVVPGGLTSIDVVDINGDGRKDLVVGNGEGRLFAYLNDGWDSTPRFTHGYELRADGEPIDLPGNARSRTVVVDYDHDGQVDLIVGAADGSVRLYRGMSEVGYPPIVREVAGGQYAFTFEVVANDEPATIERIAVRSSGWTSPFPYAAGYGLNPAGAPEILPWMAIDQIIVTFSGPVVVEQASLALYGMNLADYEIGGFSYDTVTYTATWSLARSIEFDKLRLELDGEIRDTSGNQLAPISLRFEVLPGDLNQNRMASLVDILGVRAILDTQHGDAGYNPFADIDGNGSISIVDFDQSRQYQGKTLLWVTPMHRPAATLPLVLDAAPGAALPGDVLAEVASNSPPIAIPTGLAVADELSAEVVVLPAGDEVVSAAPAVSVSDDISVDLAVWHASEPQVNTLAGETSTERPAPGSPLLGRTRDIESPVAASSARPEAASVATFVVAWSENAASDERDTSAQTLLTQFDTPSVDAFGGVRSAVALQAAFERKEGLVREAALMSLAFEGGPLRSPVLWSAAADTVPPTVATMLDHLHEKIFDDFEVDDEFESLDMVENRRDSSGWQNDDDADETAARDGLAAFETLLKRI